MNFLLKIVEGPNKGAEIALVEGVAVTLGKSDDCDIILADPTLPDAPCTVEATSSGVMLDGSSLEPYHVKTAGSTSFAVGPADVAWGELVWPVPETKGDETGGEERADAQPASPASPPEAPAEENAALAEKPRRRGCLGCLLWLIVLLLILAFLGWFFKDALKPRIEQLLEKAGMSECSGEPRSGATEGSTDAQERVPPSSGLSDIAEKYGLSITNDAGRAVLSGNFATRAERLAATAAVYSEQPGVELDFSDDESFRTAAADALFTLTEGELKVTAATNRVLSITGVSPSASALTKTLMALNADMPKLRNVDVTAVKLSGAIVPETEDSGSEESDVPSSSLPAAGRRAKKKAQAQPSLPVCGILTMPYPCLVMQNGQRILEGASVGDSVILKITADSVAVTNANGRFTWKP